MRKISKLIGEIKIDESFFGAGRVRDKRGRGAGKKTIVFQGTPLRSVWHVKTGRKHLYASRKKLLIKRSSSKGANAYYFGV